jgi:hypothetical protein
VLFIPINKGVLDLRHLHHKNNPACAPDFFCLVEIAAGIVRPKSTIMDLGIMEMVATAPGIGWFQL